MSEKITLAQVEQATPQGPFSFKPVFAVEQSTGAGCAFQVPLLNRDGKLDLTLIPDGIVAGSEDVVARAAAEAAASAASSAAAAAQQANAELADYANDNKLTPPEKSSVYRDFKAIKDEFSGVVDSATAFGINSSLYQEAYNELYTYVTTTLGLATDFSNLVAWSTTTTTIDGPTFRARFSTLYTQRQTLLNAISAEAKRLAGAAQTAADLAMQKAEDALAAAQNGAGSDGIINTFFQSTAPTVFGKGDLWLDTNDGSKLYVASEAHDKGGVWNLSADQGLYDAILAASDAADNAQVTADGKIRTFYQGTAPTMVNGENVGDLWVNTANKNELKRWSGTAWVSVRDGSILDAQNAAEGAAAVASGAASDAATAKTNADAALLDLANISSDNVLTPDEKPRVILDRDVLVNERTGILAQATAFGIVAEKTAYNDAVTALSDYLTTLTTPKLWSDLTGNTTIVGTVFRQKFGDIYSTRQILLNKIYETAKGIADDAVVSAEEANTLAAAAAADAASAAADAAAATADIANMVSDNVLTADEKPRIIMDRDVLVAEQTGIVAQAVAYEIVQDKTDYTDAITALTNYLATLTTPKLWSDLTGNTVVSGTTFRQKFGDCYAARQKLLNKIYEKAKGLADAAQITANNAMTAIGNISDDNVISDAERPTLKMLSATLQNNVTSLQTKAGSGGMGLQASAEYIAVTNAWVPFAGPSGAAYLIIYGSGNTPITKSAFDGYWSTAYGALSNLSSLMAQTAKNQAQAAIDALAIISSDGWLSKSEKPAVKINWFDLSGATGTWVASNSDVYVRATALSVSTTTFTNAMTALSAYLFGLTPVWNDTTQDTAINAATWNTNWTNAYSARLNLLNAVTDAVKVIASSKAKVFFQATAPVMTATDTGIWIDIDDGHKMYTWNGTVWILSQDSASVTNLVTDITADDKLTATEKMALKPVYDAMVAEKTNLDTQADTYGITSEKNYYDTAVGNLTTFASAKNMWPPTTPMASTIDLGVGGGETLREYIQDVLVKKQTLMQALSDKIKQIADSAISRLDTIGSDNWLSKEEVPLVQDERYNLEQTKNSTRAKAVALGLPTGTGTNVKTLDDAWTALVGYLDPLITTATGVAGKVAIVRATWRTNWQAVYTAVADLQGAISQKIKDDAATDATTKANSAFNNAVNTPTAMGDGVTKEFTFIGPDVYRVDWQGKQLLYTTARTNLVLTSEWQISNLTYNTLVPAVTNTTLVIGNYGTVPALHYTGPTTTSGGTFESVSQTGQTGSLSIVIKMDDSSQPVLGLNNTSGDFCFRVGSGIASTGTVEYQALGNSVWRVMLHGTAMGTGSYVGIARYTGNSTKSFTATCLQAEFNPTCTSYIKTTGAATPLTDYAVVGSTATLVSASVLGAIYIGLGGRDFSNAVAAAATTAMQKVDFLDGNGKLNTGVIADASIDMGKFATGIRPVQVVAGLPANPYTGFLLWDTVVNSADGKLYRMVNLSAPTTTGWTSAVPTTDLSGTIISNQIADAAVTTAKFASGITPVEILAALPTTGNFKGRMVMLTTDNKLYRWPLVATTGVVGDWTSSVPAGDITGTLVTAQFGTGQVTLASLASGAVDATKLVTGLQNAVPEIGNSLPTLPNASYPAGKLYSLTTDGKLYRSLGGSWTSVVPTTDLSGTVSTSQIAASAVQSTNIAAAAVTAAKLSIRKHIIY